MARPGTPIPKGFRQPPRGASVDLDFERALDLQAAGREGEAEALFTAILKKAPLHFGALYGLGVIRLQQGEPEAALSLLRTATACRPASAEAWNALANTLQALGRHEEAAERYRRALALQPRFAYGHNNLGNSYLALGRVEDAAASFRTAATLVPKLAVAHSNLGNALMELGRPDEALQCYQAATELNPDVGGIHNNAGKALVVLNRHEEAAARFVRASDLDPSLAQARLNLALARLSLGDYTAAWPDYEARWQISTYSRPREYPQPLWDGRADLAGKTILLYFEQGLGDTIQFARYVPLLAQRGARVLLEGPRPLLRLFASLAGAAALLAPGDPPPDFDFHAPLLSLPLAFQTTLETIPGGVPYLQAPPVRTNYSIGLCWAGNPDNPTDRERSIPLRALVPLLRIPGASFLSLQKVLREGDEEILAQFGNIDVARIRDCTDFADTAALVAGLDLVIAVDTSLAHLAGAMARPVWVLLKFSAHWAWLRHRQDSPWYPTARLFRQPRPGDWSSVIEEAAKTLAENRTSNSLPAL